MDPSQCSDQQSDNNKNKERLVGCTPRTPDNQATSVTVMTNQILLLKIIIPVVTKAKKLIKKATHSPKHASNQLQTKKYDDDGFISKFRSRTSTGLVAQLGKACPQGSHLGCDLAAAVGVAGLAAVETLVLLLRGVEGLQGL